MTKFRSTERTTVYNGAKGVRVDLAAGETRDTSDDTEIELLTANDAVNEVKPRKKKDDGS